MNLKDIPDFESYKDQWVIVCKALDLESSEQLSG
jgi:hypothetical protein